MYCRHSDDLFVQRQRLKSTLESSGKSLSMALVLNREGRREAQKCSSHSHTKSVVFEKGKIYFSFPRPVNISTAKQCTRRPYRVPNDRAYFRRASIDYRDNLDEPSALHISCLGRSEERVKVDVPLRHKP